MTVAEMAGRDVVKVRCQCGWDGGGNLEVVDRYLTDWPPGPRGNPDRWMELQTSCDPDDRVRECPACEDELDAEAVVERECDLCHGSEEIAFNPSASLDPQCEDSAPCPRCAASPL